MTALGEENLELRRVNADQGALIERQQECMVGIFKKVGRGTRCKLCNAPVYLMPHFNVPRLPDGKVQIGMYDPDGNNHRGNCVRARLRAARVGQ